MREREREGGRRKGGRERETRTKEKPTSESSSKECGRVREGTRVNTDCPMMAVVLG